MASKLAERLSHSWNTLNSPKKPEQVNSDMGPSYSVRPDRVILRGGNEQSIVSAIYTRIGMDVASTPIRHVRVDEDGNFVSRIKSSLDSCLTISANIDQSGPAFIQDAVMSLFDEGVIAIVPIDTSINPDTGSYDLLSMRTAKIIQWYPKHVRVRVWNEEEGRFQEQHFPKERVAIIENPLYSVMNEPNSTLKRLIYKLNLLDAIDKQSGSGKVDLIVQVPYAVRSDKRRLDAERRRAELSSQLENAQYGVAYTDATEKVIQLNRPVENQLMGQIEYLTRMLYSQLGITQEVFDGTADEATMMNYYQRSIKPVTASIALEFERKFLTKTARTQGQAIKFFRDPFALVTVGNLADSMDKFTRNEIISSNEARSVLGMKPVQDPRADELVNKNISQPEPESAGEEDYDEYSEEEFSEEYE